MFGVILFVIALLFYGFILSTVLLRSLLKADANPSIAAFFDKADKLAGNETARVIMAVVALAVGIWNLFAPNFGAGFSPTILGALFPSLILVLDGLVIYPGILTFFNLPEEPKAKVNKLLETYMKFAGPVTLGAGVLHIFFYNMILL